MRETDERYMRRALTLAQNGAGHVSPNPMVGAVIVARGRIIGEGYHRVYGGPHAEVNAVRSVSEADRELLGESTMYVTLEPCSHHGKTPPCADLVIREGIPRVVVGALDPFEKVSGRGIRKLEEAGREVTVGVLREECEAVNRRFMTAHRLGRPFVELKWAETADGFIGAIGSDGKPAPLQISDALTTVWMHCDRSMADAVMVGSGTVIADNPRLTLRRFPGRNPRKIACDRRGRISADANILADPDVIVIRDSAPLREVLARIYREHGITSLIVEGGEELLGSFISEGLWDEARVETAPTAIGEGVKAPEIPHDAEVIQEDIVRGHRIVRYKRESK